MTVFGALEGGREGGIGGREGERGGGWERGKEVYIDERKRRREVDGRERWQRDNDKHSH